VSYGFKARFGDARGTNPEELIAVAHAGCFGMTTPCQLSGAGHPPESPHVDATLPIEQEAGGWKIASVHLEPRAHVPALDVAKFQELAAGAKANCPMSKVLNAEITLDAPRVAGPYAARLSRAARRRTASPPYAMTVATNPQAPAKATHKPGAALSFVSSISHVAIAGVNPPNSAVASA